MTSANEDSGFHFLARIIPALILLALVWGQPDAVQAQSPVSEVKDSGGNTLMTVFDNGDLTLFDNGAFTTPGEIESSSGGFRLPDGRLIDSASDLQLTLPYSDSASNSDPLLEIEQTGTGSIINGDQPSAGVFRIENTNNSFAALKAETNGGGETVFGMQTGTGQSGRFVINNINNTSAALFARSNGSGPAVWGLQSGDGFGGKFVGSVNADPGGNPGAHVALVENTNSNDGSDVLAIKAGENSGNITTSTNFITFYGSGGQAIGALEGQGGSGVTLSSGGADVAEELPVAGGAKRPEPTDLVGVRGGEVRLRTKGADRLMVVSSAPVVTGNATPGTEGDDDRRVPVAFIGQVPVKVRGPVEVGDWIVASGQHDGTARAVAPSEYRPSEHGPIAGQAWSAKSSEGIGDVTVAVGLGTGPVLAKRLADQQRRNDRQEARIADLERRLRALEAERSSVVVSLGGSMIGILILLLGGGLAGALLWHRRR